MYPLLLYENARYFAYYVLPGGLGKHIHIPNYWTVKDTQNIYNNGEACAYVSLFHTLSVNTLLFPFIPLVFFLIKGYALIHDEPCLDLIASVTVTSSLRIIQSKSLI